jgi:hypothetical protein
MDNSQKDFLATAASGALMGAAAAAGDPHPANVAGGVLLGAFAGFGGMEAIRALRAGRRQHMEEGYRAARNEPSFEEQASWANDLGRTKAIASTTKPSRRPSN